MRSCAVRVKNSDSANGTCKNFGQSQFGKPIRGRFLPDTIAMGVPDRHRSSSITARLNAHKLAFINRAVRVRIVQGRLNPFFQLSRQNLGKSGDSSGALTPTLAAFRPQFAAIEVA